MAQEWQARLKAIEAKEKVTRLTREKAERQQKVIAAGKAASGRGRGHSGRVGRGRGGTSGSVNQKCLHLVILEWAVLSPS